MFRDSPSATSFVSPDARREHRFVLAGGTGQELVRMTRKSGVLYLAALALLVASAHAQTPPSPYGQLGSSFPGACPINKVSDVIVTVVATLPQSSTGPLSVSQSSAFFTSFA